MLQSLKDRRENDGLRAHTVANAAVSLDWASTDLLSMELRTHPSESVSESFASTDGHAALQAHAVAVSRYDGRLPLDNIVEHVFEAADEHLVVNLPFA